MDDIAFFYCNIEQNTACVIQECKLSSTLSLVFEAVLKVLKLKMNIHKDTFILNMPCGHMMGMNLKELGLASISC